MNDLQIRDLPVDQALDAAAVRDIKGGWTGFLAGLVAPLPGAQLVPSVTNNFFIDYDQTIVQQNPVNLTMIAGDGAVNSIGSLNITPVNIGSPVSVFQDVTGN